MLNFEFSSFGKLQKGSPSFHRPITMNNGQMSSNKNAHIELESFLLDPDSLEGMKGSGKVRKKFNSVQLPKMFSDSTLICIDTRPTTPLCLFSQCSSPIEY